MKTEYIRHPDLRIAQNDLSPDEKSKVISIETDGVVLGFGPTYSNISRVSFSDCEKLWSV